VLNFGVDEGCRGQGIGTALISRAEEYVRGLGGEALDLNVFAFNTGAI
jgi:ribosomal protein S18 acetylase RimI-like enzyme